MKIKTNRPSPLSGMRVAITEIVDLDAKTVDEVFYHRLAELTEGLWLKGNTLMRTIDMQGHGSDYDEEVANVADPEWTLPVAALMLKRALLDAAV